MKIPKERSGQLRCPKVGQLKSPTLRACNEATKCKRLTGLSQICRLEVKEAYDPHYKSLGKIIQDPSEANRLYDKVHGCRKVVEKKTVKVRRKINPLLGRCYYGDDDY